MTPERDGWPEVKQILAKALQLPLEERRKFILENCPNPELQALSLLYVSDPDAGATDLSNSASLAISGGDPWTGRQVGPYLVHHLLDEGGFGAVYLAVRTDNTKKVVAIKFLLHEDNREAVRDAFAAEMRFLAQLNHPNIVALLDAGVTPEGHPYYVMEYVEGWNITEYCARKHLDTKQRLKLFLQVCDASQYIHDNLLVHRDLKPSNIRVTNEGRVKVLDFGVAQSWRPERTGDGPLFTGAIGTVCYASPEQLSGEPVTKASDIYSLGAILFELLTTRTPFLCKGISRDELMNTVLHQTPPLMSAAVDVDAVQSLEAGSLRQLRRSLEGDLDSIVAMALSKDPDRRYASVSALAGDVHSHLSTQPVSARPNHLSYRAGRFVSRNRRPVITATIAFLGLIVGLILWRTETPTPPTQTQTTGAVAEMTAEQMDRRGNDYHLGRGVPKDDVEAVNWFRRSAELGYPRGQSDLGVMYLWGWGVERSYSEALRLFKDAAAKGDVEAENGLGIMNEFALGTPRNYVDAMNWYLKAASVGYARAESNIGSMYQEGHGVTKNYGEAMNWYRKAADQHDPGGQDGIGLLYCFELGVPKDYQEALKWFHMAADQEDGFAQSHIGYMYEKGWGVLQSNDQALQWYRMSAGQGNRSGQYNLGYMYEYGLGVDKNVDEAIKWFRLSADQGYSLAQATLGAIYADGIDGHPNYFEAGKWFEMVADEDPVAMDFFGEFYEKGWGGSADMTKALEWYRKGAQAGSESAKESLARLTQTNNE